MYDSSPVIEAFKSFYNGHVIGLVLEIGTVLSGFFMTVCLIKWRTSPTTGKVFLLLSLVLILVTFPFVSASPWPLWFYIGSWFFFFITGAVNPDWYFNKYLK